LTLEARAAGPTRNPFKLRSFLVSLRLKKAIARCTVCVSLFPSLAALAAQDGAGKLDPDAAPKRGQYVYDSFGHNARAGFSERCVDTGFWDAASATVECDPNLFASRVAPKPHTAAAEKPAAKSAAASAAGASGASAAHENSAASAPQGNTGTPATYPAASASVPRANATPAALSSTSRPEAQAAAASNAAPANSASTADKAWSGSVVPVPLAAAPAGDQTGATTQLHEEDQTPARDDGILAEHRYYDEGGGAKDDGILGSSRYSDEYLSTARGDGINALNQYHDEGGGAARDDGIIAHNVYGNDDSGAKSESLPGQPKAFPQGNETAAAAANKLPAITMLPVTITVEADPLFDFDQAAVREDSRKKLDDLIQQLQGVTYGDVIVVGFADPIGTAIYNQSLSWRRAESVEQYLAKHGLPASRIRAEGRGETEEFATFESCGGIRNEQAIACLQPDRRVEVTITAKRQHQASN